MAQKAVGTTLSYVKGGVTTAVGLLRGIGEIKMDSEAVDVTTLDGDGSRAYEQGLRDGGEIAVDGYHSGDEAGQAALRTLYMSGESVPFTVAFPDGTAVSFSAFVKSVSLGAIEVDGMVKFSATLRVTGGVTVS